MMKETNVKPKIVFAAALGALALLAAPVVMAQSPRTPQQICDDATPAPEPESRTFAEPDQVLQPGVNYGAILCTGAGPIYVDLFEDYTPITVNNFVFLAEQGYFNNTTFHRVIQDFMAQGGDPTGTGTGGPGYNIQDEVVGFLTFDEPGFLAMANTGQANSGGSQFFITTVPYTSLDFKYTIFGRVLEGQDNVAAIKLRDPAAATEPGEALNTVVIITDPSEVDTTHVPPTLATADDFRETLSALTAQIPAPLLEDPASTGVFTTDETVAMLPEGEREAASALFAAHGHEFRVEHRVTNSTCEFNLIPYMAVSYILDRYATPEDARAALDDGWYVQQYVDDGFTSETIEGQPYPLLTKTETICDQQATHAVTFYLRGHSIATASVVIPADHPVAPIRWLNELVTQTTYEVIFAKELRSELP